MAPSDENLPRSCPNCTRAVIDESEIRFCMYCGYQLPDREPTAVELPAVVEEPPTILLEPLDGSGQSGLETTDFVAAPVEIVLERIGSFRLLRKLGTGGMGHVFEAESDENGERVALKLLSPKLTTNPNSVERFKQEGRLASQISHPRCVFVYGVDADADRPFIVMELMPGSTLKDLVDTRGPLPWANAIHRILDVIEGLIEAHRLGMLHRDVKPSNCFLTDDDRVKIGDFGLSKSLDNQHHQKQLTSTGAFLGTVLFASPEQIRGQEVGYDSDVYSVAATLYYLLMGKAPHHHISMTAALAKVISEPPPAIRTQRPEVPKVLERIVFKGLERDRNRRYASLEELRDALLDILPERQQPSRVRSLIAAYLLDVLFCALLLAIPMEWLIESLFDGGIFRANPAMELAQLFVLVAYFGFSEGITGGTVGKLLLRLRVTRVGEVGPPGFLRAVFRAAVFHAILALILGTALLAFRQRTMGIFLGCGAILAGAIGLFVQRRRSQTHRGIHDRASGCRVVQRPRRPLPTRLVGLSENPLDRPTIDPSLPPLVGGFAVVGVLGELGDDEAIWVAEDEALHRRILLWVRPARQLPDGVPVSPVRPGRLRVVSTGELVWKSGVYAWVAFVAPTGAPLEDTISELSRLSWTDARMILEQLVQELEEGQADGSNPPRLGLNQMWVEPSGRLHLLEFPLPTNRAPTEVVNEPIQLIRQVATLILEGKARSGGGRLQAPLPPHASQITDALFDPTAPHELGALRRKLAASHSYPPEVSTGMRTAHIGVLLAISAVGFLLMLVGSVGFSLRLAIQSGEQANLGQKIALELSSPQTVASWRQESPRLRELLGPEKLAETRSQIELQHSRDAELWQLRLSRLSRLERVIAEEYVSTESGLFDNSPNSRMRQLFEARLNRSPNANEDREGSSTRRMAIGWVIVLLGVLFTFAGFAFVFRGGLSYTLSGISLVQEDGRRTTRLMCAIRELAIWFPFVLLLSLNIGLQSHYPEWIYVRLAFAIGIGLIAIAYLVVGVMYSNRGPHDELVGTYMVPG